jgi:hypothetical protein
MVESNVLNLFKKEELEEANARLLKEQEDLAPLIIRKQTLDEALQTANTKLAAANDIYTQAKVASDNAKKAHDNARVLVDSIPSLSAANKKAQDANTIAQKEYNDANTAANSINTLNNAIAVANTNKQNAEKALTIARTQQAKNAATDNINKANNDRTIAEAKLKDAQTAKTNLPSLKDKANKAQTAATAAQTELSKAENTKTSLEPLLWDKLTQAQTIAKNEEANVAIANSALITAQAAVNDVDTSINLSEVEIDAAQAVIQLQEEILREKQQAAQAERAIHGLSSYNLIADQNKILNDAIQKTKNKNTTYNQKHNYQNGDIVFINRINNYLFLIYYFILLFVCYYLFYDNAMNWKIKVGILFVFAIYPYIFNLINYYLSKLIAYIYSIINITAYQYN